MFNPTKKYDIIISTKNKNKMVTIFEKCVTTDQW